MKPTTITPGQIFFRQRNISDVEFALVLDVKGSTVTYTSIGKVNAEGSRTSGSITVKPNPADRIIKMFNAFDEFDYNQYVGCTFGGNLYTFEEQGVPYIPAYHLFTMETITLHDLD